MERSGGQDDACAQQRCSGSRGFGVWANGVIGRGGCRHGLVWQRHRPAGNHRAVCVPARTRAAPPKTVFAQLPAASSEQLPRKQVAAALPAEKPLESHGKSKAVEIGFDALRERIPPNAPVKIMQIPGRGRGLVATRAIKSGEPILWEEPLAWELEEPWRERRCASCARGADENHVMVPCRGCNGAFHICDTCEAHPSCKDFARIVETGKTSPTPNAMASLKVAKALLRGGSDGACVEALTWRRVPYSPDMDVFSGWTMASVIHSAHVRLVCNQFTVRMRDMTPIGRGLYPATSMFNSDCCPNITTCFQSDSPTEMTILTTRTVEAGEELCGCYVEVYQPRSVRQQQLKSGWGFDCSCSRCMRCTEPTGDERHLFGVRCHACGTLLADQEGEQCSCGHDDPAARNCVVQQAMSTRDDAARKIAKWASQSFGMLQRQLHRGRVSFGQTDNPDDALDAIQESLAILRTALSGLHREVLWTLQVLGEAERRCGREKEYSTHHAELNNMRGERVAWLEGRGTNCW